MADDDIIVRRYNKEFVFPKGTSPQDVEAYLARNKPPSSTVIPEPVPRQRSGNTFGGLSRAVGRGASFNFLDELSSIGSAATGGDYSSDLARRRAEDRSYDEDNPVSSTAGQVLGGVIATGAGLAALTRGRRNGPVATSAGRRTILNVPREMPAVAPGRFRRGLELTGIGAGIGGMSGALSGFGAGEGGFDNRLDNAIEGGKIGAAIGAVVPGAVSTIGAGARKVRDLITTPAAQRATEKAGRDIGTAAVADEVSPQTASRIGRSHDAPNLGSLGPELRNLYDRAAWTLSRPTGPGNTEHVARSIVAMAMNPSVYNAARVGMTTPLWRRLWGRVSGMPVDKAQAVVRDLAENNPRAARQLLEDAFDILESDAVRRAATTEATAVTTVPLAERGMPAEK